MKVTTIIIISLFVVVGCSSQPEKQLDWQKAPYEYVWTMEQNAKIEQEAKWCSDNTSYISEYCYGTAIMRNATKVDKK
jgi:uncharacterized protein YcfL